jgi:carotenoid cleavage dioxygenase-like enzyme
MFHYWGDRNPRHGLPAHPKVDFVSGILMFLGLGLAWYRWRDPRFFFFPSGWPWG